jgi:hypothetical protein
MMLMGYLQPKMLVNPMAAAIEVLEKAAQLGHILDDLASEYRKAARIAQQAECPVSERTTRRHLDPDLDIVEYALARRAVFETSLACTTPLVDEKPSREAVEAEERDMPVARRVRVSTPALDTAADVVPLSRWSGRGQLVAA